MKNNELLQEADDTNLEETKLVRPERKMPSRQDADNEGAVTEIRQDAVISEEEARLAAKREIQKEERRLEQAYGEDKIHLLIPPPEYLEKISTEDIEEELLALEDAFWKFRNQLEEEGRIEGVKQLKENKGFASRDSQDYYDSSTYAKFEKKIAAYEQELARRRA